MRVLIPIILIFLAVAIILCVGQALLSKPKPKAPPGRRGPYDFHT